jgi:hypothetical protein
MKALATMLKSANPKLQTWSVCAIGNLCIDNSMLNKNDLTIKPKTRPSLWKKVGLAKQ